MSIATPPSLSPGRPGISAVHGWLSLLVHGDEVLDAGALRRDGDKLRVRPRRLDAHDCDAADGGDAQAKSAVAAVSTTAWFLLATLSVSFSKSKSFSSL